jgi:hypothetical protein
MLNFIYPEKVCIRGYLMPQANVSFAIKDSVSHMKAF